MQQQLESESTKALNTLTYINNNPSSSSFWLAGILTLDLFVLREAVQPLDHPGRSVTSPDLFVSSSHQFTCRIHFKVFQLGLMALTDQKV